MQDGQFQGFWRKIRLGSSKNYNLKFNWKIHQISMNQETLPSHYSNDIICFPKHKFYFFLLVYENFS